MCRLVIFSLALVASFAAGGNFPPEEGACPDLVSEIDEPLEVLLLQLDSTLLLSSERAAVAQLPDHSSNLVAEEVEPASGLASLAQHRQTFDQAPATAEAVFDPTVVPQEDGASRLVPREEHLPPMVTRLLCLGGTVVIVMAAIVTVLWQFAAQGVAEAAGDRMAQQMKAIEVFYILCTFWTMTRITAIIPQSLALSADLGQGAAFSGVIIASCYALTLVGTACSRGLTLPWDQTLNRRCIILFGVLLSVTALLVAVAANPPMAWGLSNRGRIGVLISARLLEGFFEVLLRILLRTLTYKLTPKSQMVGLSLFRTCALTLGTGTGPFIPWGTHYVFGDIGGVVLLSRSFVFIAAVTACIPVACYLLLPSDLAPFLAAKESVDRCAMQTRQALEGVVRQSTAETSVHQAAAQPTGPVLEAKRGVIISHLVFSGCRGFVCEALTAATAMILEVEFRFSTHNVGLLIALCFYLGFPIMILLQYLRRSRAASDGQLLCLLIAVAFAAALLLHEELSAFAVGARHSWVLVLVADALIFGCTFNANGVSDGLAMRHAVPDTWFSQENVVALDVAVNTFFRMFAPISARLLVDLGGRSLYAAMQMAATGLMLQLSLQIKGYVEEIGNLEEIKSTPEVTTRK